MLAKVTSADAAYPTNPLTFRSKIPHPCVTALLKSIPARAGGAVARRAGRLSGCPVVSPGVTTGEEAPPGGGASSGGSVAEWGGPIPPPGPPVIDVGVLISAGKESTCPSYTVQTSASSTTLQRPGCASAAARAAGKSSRLGNSPTTVPHPVAFATSTTAVRSASPESPGTVGRWARTNRHPRLARNDGVATAWGLVGRVVTSSVWKIRSTTR